ncbi:MAG: hypothetical protein AAB884_02795 [Patescibacteria group bacterium]
MNNKKKFYQKEKINNKLIKLGLSSIAVLMAVTDNVLARLLSFPEKSDSIGRALKKMNDATASLKTSKEYLEELQEISGFNLRVILGRLEEKGLIVREKNKNYRLTDVGSKFLGNTKDKIMLRKQWDGKWHLVTFDIPEKRRSDRDWLRYVLQLHEYKKLQKSVFLGKFALPERIFREIYDRKLNACVRLLTVGEIDEENL